MVYLMDPYTGSVDTAENSGLIEVVEVNGEWVEV